MNKLTQYLLSFFILSRDRWAWFTLCSKLCGLVSWGILSLTMCGGLCWGRRAGSPLWTAYDWRRGRKETCLVYWPTLEIFLFPQVGWFLFGLLDDVVSQWVELHVHWLVSYWAFILIKAFHMMSCREGCFSLSSHYCNLAPGNSLEGKSVNFGHGKWWELSSASAWLISTNDFLALVCFQVWFSQEWKEMLHVKCSLPAWHFFLLSML